MSRAVRTLGALIPLVVGCSALDSPADLRDLRVLAVVTEPAEVQADPAYLFLELPAGLDLPVRDVDITVWAFDPRGGVVDVEARMCPPARGDEDDACAGFDVDAFAPETTVRDGIEAFFAPTGGRYVGADGASDPARRVPIAPLRRRVTSSVLRGLMGLDDGTAAASDQSGGLGLGGLEGVRIPFFTPVYARFQLTVENVDALPHDVVRERAFKRLPIGIDTTTLAFVEGPVRDAITAATGIPPCDPSNPPPSLGHEVGEDGVIVDGDGNPTGVELGPSSCLWPRLANNNPWLSGLFRLPPDARPEKLVIGPGNLDVHDTIFASRGTELSISPAFQNPPDLHQTLTFDAEAERLRAEIVVEDYVADFAATGGTLDREQSVALLDVGLAVVWRLPSSRPVGARDTLVLVVRDQRGGTSVGTLTVIYTE